VARINTLLSHYRAPSLCYSGRKPHQDGVAYRNTCPATKVLVVLYPKRRPQPVTAAPADAVPMERVSA
jgi:hypothetical protein